MTYSQRLSAKQYFIVVALLTLVLLGLNLAAQPVLKAKLGGMLAALRGEEAHIQAAQDAFFTERVAPIFSQYCAACHDERKAKGKLRLDNFLSARYSGKSGRVVVPFDTHASQLLARMRLDHDDKRLMPPLGWDRPNDDELSIISLWIEKGASPLLPAADFPEAPAAVREVEIPMVDTAAVDLARQPVLAALEKMQARFPHAFSFMARDSALLRFTNVSLQHRLTDENFTELAAIAPHLGSLYLYNTQLTEKSAPILLNMRHISDAYLDGVQFAEATLTTFIQQQQRLRQISLPKPIISAELQRLCVARGVKLKGVSRE